VCKVIPFLYKTAGAHQDTGIKKEGAGLRTYVGLRTTVEFVNTKRNSEIQKSLSEKIKGGKEFYRGRGKSQKPLPIRLVEKEELRTQRKLLLTRADEAACNSLNA